MMQQILLGAARSATGGVIGTGESTRTVPGAQRLEPPTADDFSSVLSGFARQTVDAVRAGESAAAAGLQGRLPVQEVVEKVMAAEHAVQAAIAVRDKVVAAYLEISRMQI